MPRTTRHIACNWMNPPYSRNIRLQHMLVRPSTHWHLCKFKNLKRPNAKFDPKIKNQNLRICPRWTTNQPCSQHTRSARSWYKWSCRTCGILKLLIQIVLQIFIENGDNHTQTFYRFIRRRGFKKEAAIAFFTQVPIVTMSTFAFPISITAAIALEQIDKIPSSAWSIQKTRFLLTSQSPLPLHVWFKFCGHWKQSFP